MSYLPILRMASVLSLATVLTGAALTGPAMAQEAFTLTSPVISDGDMLPAFLKCTRDGGGGLSPPLAWVDAPDGTESYAIIMHHYPSGRVEGEDTPSQYWLLWNISASTTSIDAGNPKSIGDEGADKDERRTGYTPPCSPPGPPHEYTITVFALSAPPLTLPEDDDGDVNWEDVIAAIDGLVLGSSALTFLN